MINQIYKALSECEEVEAIVLGGSRSGQYYDQKSDYDVYVYCKAKLSEAKRELLLKPFCSKIEIGNCYWECEDNCTMSDGIDLDLIYRNLDDFMKDIIHVVDEYQAHNGYTTCMWRNLMTSTVIVDKSGRYTEFQKNYTIAYPKVLKENIIKRNLNLMDGILTSYYAQIEKAIQRHDLVSINHRIAEFLASYFDVLFAVNEIAHPGEKRLVQICLKECECLPLHFEEDLNDCFENMFINGHNTCQSLRNLLIELKKIC